MDSRIARAGALARTLPAARFGEWHAAVLRARPEAVWRAVHEIRWRELRLTLPLLLLRGFGPALDAPCFQTLAARGAQLSDPPRESAFVVVGRPWRLRPGFLPDAPRTMREVRDFAEPGWLKYGMEWRLTPLDAERTLVETATLCEAGDAAARRRFAPYWALIRLPSGLVRRDMLAAIRRRLAAG